MSRPDLRAQEFTHLALSSSPSIGPTLRVRIEQAGAPLTADSATRVDRARHLVTTYSRDLVLLAIVIVVAAVVRLVALGDIPPGFHGDEAVAGLEANRILHNGSIGPYSLEALGVPAGTFYWTAGVFLFAGKSVYTIRFAFALIGILTVGLTYVAARVAFGRVPAALAALFLSVWAWHVAYSRVAFIPLGWPPMEVLTLACFVVAWRKSSLAWAAAAGVCLGAGLYTYQAFLTFVVAFAIAIVVLGICFQRTNYKRYLGMIGATVVAALIVAIPMIKFANQHPDIYFGRYKEYSVLRSPEYKALPSTTERLRYLVGRETHFFHAVTEKSAPDGVDASGVIPMVDAVSAALIILGIVIALVRFKRPEYLGLLIIAAVLAGAPVLAYDGMYRRTLGLTPLLAMLAALPLTLLWEEARTRGRLPAIAAGATVLILLVVVSETNLRRYFTTYDDHQAVWHTYGADLVNGLNKVKALPEDTDVYLISDGTHINHPPVQFILSGHHLADASTEYKMPDFALAPDRTRDAAFLLMGKYLTQASRFEAQFPGGQESKGYDKEGSLVYVVYFLPKL